MRAKFSIARHEDITDGIMARLRQVDALTRHFFAEETIRNLDKHTRTVAHQRVGANRTTMGEVFKHLETVFNNLMRLLAFHMRDEADATGVMFITRVIKALGGRRARRSSRRFSGCVGGIGRSFDRSVLTVV